ncbi:MAG: hypothetical protein ACRC7S_14755 [Cetobacterium sp.]
MYKIKFNEYQKIRLNSEFYNKGRKENLSSVLAKIIKYSEDGVLKTTLSKLHRYTAFGRYKTLSRSYFYELVDQLFYMKLLKRVDKKIHIILHDELEDKKTDKSEIAVTIDNTDFECNLEKLKDKDYINTNTSIYNNTLNEVVAPVEVISKIKEVAKDLGINRSKTIDKIEKMISKQIMTYSIKVQRFGLVEYLRKAITEKYNQLYFHSTVAYKTRIKAKAEAMSFIIGTSEYSIVNADNIAKMEAAACL